MRKQITFLLFALLCGMQTMAMNLVLVKQDGTSLAKNIAAIGKWVYAGDNLRLLDKAGNLLAEENVMDIQRIVFSTASAVENLSADNAATILVYPNPTQDALMVSGADCSVLRVFDLQGRLLKSAQGNSISVNELSDGTYLLQVGTQVVRFIKQ